MRLTTLGSSTPYARPGNACSGYLVQSDTTTLWMDAGAGTLAELQRHAALDRLDGIWVSHAHADHSADLLMAYYALRFSGIRRPEPLPLIIPPGLRGRLVSYLGGQAETIFDEAFAVTEMTDVASAVIGDLALSWAPVRHDQPAFALRVEADSASLAYSGDTASCRELVDLASGCDAMLCEAGSDEHGADADPVHHTPEEAGATATAAGVRNLIITHIGDGVSGEVAAMRAQGRFAGPVDVARPGAVFPINPR